MTSQIISDDFDQKSWNLVVNHPLQSWQWGVARQAMGIQVLRIGQFEGTKLVSAFQLTLHPLPKTKYKIGYLPRSVFLNNQVLEFFKEYGVKNHLIFIKIEPDVLKHDQHPKLERKDLVRSPHPLFPEWTQTIDLTQSEKLLFDNLKSKTRYNIKLAQKKGVTVVEQTDSHGFEVFSKLYFATCQRQKYYGHNLKYHQLVFDNLKKDIAHLLIAYYNSTPLAAYELFHFKNKLYYPYGGTSIEHRNLMASNLLMWEAIKFGKKLNLREFDMWGSLAPGYEQSHDWAGFTRFKEGYNAKFTQFIGSYDLIISPNLYRLYNFVQPIRKILLRLFKV